MTISMHQDVFYSILITCCFFSGITCWLIYSGIKPVYVPMALFKLLSRYGESSTISENREYFEKYFLNSEFFDERYQAWHDEIVGRDSILQGEYLALIRRSIYEKKIRLFLGED